MVFFSLGVADNRLDLRSMRSIKKSISVSAHAVSTLTNVLVTYITTNAHPCDIFVDL